MGAHVAQLSPLDSRMLIAISVITAGIVLACASQLRDDGLAPQSSFSLLFLLGLVTALVSTALAAVCGIVDELVFAQHRRMDSFQFAAAVSVFGTLQISAALLAAQIIPGNDHGVQVWPRPLQHHTY
jgi:drug/metabolite transporter (DMT)-like permease